MEYIKDRLKTCKSKGEDFEMKELCVGAKIKKNIGILLLISILIVTSISFGGVAYADSGTDGSGSEVTFAGGSGTETDPYIIETAEQLDAVRNNLRASYRLNADIEFTEADFAEGGKFYNEGKGWIPINNFSGTFDGNGHVIRNIVINSSIYSTGFFGSCGGDAKIMSLGIENGDIIGEFCVGGIVAQIKGGLIEKCYYSGTVNGDNDVGGIAGAFYEDTVIRACYNAASVTGEVVGGIVGSCNGESTIKDCYNANSLTGYSAGGIVGSLESGEISSCYNVGNIKKGSKLGEIAGTNNKGSITNCYYIEAQLLGVGNGTDTATACLLERFAVQATFEGFNFDAVWTIDENGLYRFPTLQDLPNDVTFGLTENFADFAGGYGIKSSPYIVTNAQQLNNVRNYLDASFKLANDIEFTESDFTSGGDFYNDGKGWEAIGTSSTPFTGMFDGNGYVIKGLQCKQTTGNAGLFGYNAGAIIKLGIVSGAVKGSTAGGICASNSGLISRCYNTCTVTGSRAGGITGDNQRIIKDCYNSGEVSGNYPVGGIAGYNHKQNRALCEIVDCYNIGRIGGITRGSIAGITDENAVIKDCYYSNIGIKASNDADDNAGATSLADLRKQETYAGFDFENIWTIDTKVGYWLPTLQGMTNYAVAPMENTTDFAGGYGTYDSPYLIKTKQQLDNIRKDLYASYRLENDIVFEKKDFSKTGTFYNEGKRWEPIGSEDNQFYGNLDGNKHCIKGLIIERQEEYVCALFSYTRGEIKNLCVSEFKVSGMTRAYITAYNRGVIDGCSNIDSIKFDTGFDSKEDERTEFTGVFCYRNGGTIKNCYNLGNIEANGYIGVMAYENYGIIKQCYNAGDITAAKTGAGIAVRSNGKIYDCYNTGDIKTGGYAGGIAGRASSIATSYNTGAVISYNGEDYVDGIVGDSYDCKVENCYSLDTRETYNVESKYGKICTIGQMIKKETYKGFDFENVWELDESGEYKFPVLKGVKNYAAARTENATDFAGGYGTKSKPYIIENKTQLNNVRKELNACYKLNADIVFSAADFAESGMFYNDGKGWAPIGDAENIFTGTLNGNGHTIFGLKITRNEEKNIGLFGCSCGIIKNIKIANCLIGGGTNVGSIAGYIKYGKIINCETEGNIAAYGKETDSYSEYCKLGGIAGTADNGEIIDSVNYVTVNAVNNSGRTYAGGIVGSNDSSSIISNCCNYGLVKKLNGESDSSLGGIKGYDYRGDIKLCYNVGEIQGLNDGANAGGLVGYKYIGTVKNSYNIGNVTSKTGAGGIIGEGKFQISGCYNAGKISVLSVGEDDEWRDGYAGGIAGGVTYGSVLTKCYNIGNVISARGSSGGIIGESYDDSDITITTCYNIGEISCQAGNAGGIAGESAATISDCFYLDNISKGVGSGTDAATKCSSADMQNEETYGEAFDFDYDMIWAISGTAEYKYPVLTEVVNPEFQYTLSLEAKQGVPEVPVAVSYGNGKITVKAAAGQKYVCVADSEAGESGIIPALSSLDWKSASGSMLTFEGLEQGRTYRIYTYIPAAGGKSASYVSQPLVVTLKEVGDLSGDGKIDSSDAFYLRRAFAGWDGYELNFSAADVNADGKLSADDIMILERYIAGWSSYKTLPVRK